MICDDCVESDDDNDVHDINGDDNLESDDEAGNSNDLVCISMYGTYKTPRWRSEEGKFSKKQKKWF